MKTLQLVLGGEAVIRDALCDAEYKLEKAGQESKRVINLR